MNTNYEKISTWDRVMMAITFAEAGEPETAVKILNQKKIEKQNDNRLRQAEQRPELRL